MVQLCHSAPDGVLTVQHHFLRQAQESPETGGNQGKLEKPWQALMGQLNTRKLERGYRMTLTALARVASKTCLIAAIGLGLSACGGGGGGLFGGNGSRAEPRETRNVTREAALDGERSSIFDLFSGADDPNTTVEVNKYLWVASLDVLNFLPIESVDPFTGVIVTGYGRPPGGGRAYRATIYVQDPALDARSLKVALQSQGGAPVAPEVQRAVEDAILTRARQLRIQDGGL
jgi:hypothetical protein